MNEWFFYQERGKTVGPYSVEDIKGRIRDGRIRVFDLLYKDGEPSWRMALEHTTLRGEFKTSTLASLKERPWVCLQKKSAQTLEFVTTGPFTQDEIRDALQAGKISYSDYAWKDSLAEWKRIGSLEEFNPRARQAVLPSVPPVPQGSSADLLKNVVEFQRPRPVNAGFEDIPPEAREDFLPPPVPSASGSKTKPPPVATSQISATIKRSPELKRESDEAEREEKSQPWLDWSVVGVLVLVLIVAVALVSRFILPKSAVELPDANPVAVETPAPSTKIETVPEKPIARERTEPPPPPHEPQELVLAAHAGAGGGQPQIELRTDGTAEFPLYVQIIGLPGQVSEGGAFYRFIRVTPKGKLRESLEIPDLKLPQGKFIARAETGDLKKETKFTWGMNDPQYKGLVARQRKIWAHALWKERLNLFVLSDALEKQVSQALMPSKQFPAKKWDSLINLKRTDGAKYLMFEDWWELHSIAKEAKVGVTGPLAARAAKERDHLTAFTVWK